MVPSGEWGKSFPFAPKNRRLFCFPLQLKLSRGVIKASVGNHHLIYLKEGGSVWGKGSNSVGQLGQASRSNYSDPVEIVSDGAVDVATGFILR